MNRGVIWKTNTYEAVLVPGISVVPRTVPFQETVTVPGKEISAWKGPVLPILPSITISMPEGDGLVMSYFAWEIWSERREAFNVGWSAGVRFSEEK